MEELNPGELDAVQSSRTSRDGSTKINPAEEHHKKRRKLAHKEQILDFVHLPRPKPKAKLDEVNRKPFQPIAVLNQLNEPPPSAALFPPITPSKDEHCPDIVPDGEQCSNKSVESPGASLSKQGSIVSGKAKRVYLRPRRNWTEEETNCLIEGIALCGVGRWKDILSHPKFHFHESRTHVDLKDRFRTLYPQKHPEKWAARLSDSYGSNASHLESARSTQRRRCSGKRATYRNWSDLEDAELDKGFEKFGFQWNLIAQDELLEFDNRSANQIRDRFRRRYPEKYGEPAPEPPPAIGGGVKKASSKASQKKHISSAAARTEKNLMDALNTDQGRAMTGNFAALTFPDDLLNRKAPEEDSDFRKSLAALDNDLKLPPLHWDDMAVQPIFDLG